MMKTALSLLVVVFAACTSADEPTVDRTPTVASEPAHAPTISNDWRARGAADVAAMKQTSPTLLAELQALAPSKTRAGHLRFTSTLPSDPRATSVLLDRLTRGASDDERAALVEALPRTTGTYADALVDLYDTERVPTVRAVYVFAAKRAPSELALHVIRRGLADRDPVVQAEAARTAASHAVGAQVETELRAALGANSAVVRAAAARALGVLGIEAARDDLVHRLSHDAAEVRLQALRALDRVAPGAVGGGMLGQLARDTDPRVSALASKLDNTATR